MSEQSHILETHAFENALTPDIKKKLQEARLAAMGESSSLSPLLFEALDLTDKQRTEMKKIVKELEPEFEKHAQIYGDNAAKIGELSDASFRQGPIIVFPPDMDMHDHEAVQKEAQRQQDAYMKKMSERPERQRIHRETYASRKSLEKLLRTCVMDILDESQRYRLQELIDNPPPHALSLIWRFRREYGASDVGDPSNDNRQRADSNKNGWHPGPDSWRPGDPIPEMFRQKDDTKKVFPKKEK